jgi:cyclic pyranopterin phosphate synthase
VVNYGIQKSLIKAILPPGGDTVKETTRRGGNTLERKITHLDERGNAVMVDVTTKESTDRLASARGKILMNPKTLSLIASGEAKKGDVLAVARIAGIMAAKKTHELIPLCHPLSLTGCAVDFELNRERSFVEANCSVRVTGVTGVEMEALVGVTTALLTIYDMLKAVDRGMEITDVCLLEKSGGNSGRYVRSERETVRGEKTCD